MLFDLLRILISLLLSLAFATTTPGALMQYVGERYHERGIQLSRETPFGTVYERIDAWDDIDMWANEEKVVFNKWDIYRADTDERIAWMEPQEHPVTGRHFFPPESTYFSSLGPYKWYYGEDLAIRRATWAGSFQYSPREYYRETFKFHDGDDETVFWWGAPYEGINWAAKHRVQWIRVPEPANWMLLGVGVACFLALELTLRRTGRTD